MSGFLRIVGNLTFLGAIIGWIVAATQNGTWQGFWLLFPQAITAMVGGVLLAAFGTMLEHLSVIRDEAEKQTRLLDRLVNPPAPVVTPPTQDPRRDYLAGVNFKFQDN